jgi:hypothetical protein
VHTRANPNVDVDLCEMFLEVHCEENKFHGLVEGTAQLNMHNQTLRMSWQHGRSVFVFGVEAFAHVAHATLPGPGIGCRMQGSSAEN